MAAARSFYEVIGGSCRQDLSDRFRRVGCREVERALGRDHLAEEDLVALISPAADNYLEEMAWRARETTTRQFGRVMLLYSPLYLADYCENSCLYCGFKVQNDFPRRKLEMPEVEREAQSIAATGIEHILLLTGESRKHSPPAYIKECIGLLRDYFPSLAVEIYPLTEGEYRDLAAAGLDGVTIYQEVYDEQVYRQVHPQGPKRDYPYRLETPERIGRAGVRTLNIGALLGLYDWRSEAYWTARHAAWLQERFPEVELSISVPRLQPHPGHYNPLSPVADRHLVQIILACRLFLPQAGITLSTRERPELRDNLVGLGVTKISAGSRTDVGGYAIGAGTSQFEIADRRTVAQIREMISGKGYQPIFRDWV